MSGVTPEEKLLNVIKNAQNKMRLKKELKVFTKVNIVLISLIAVISTVFLIDLFTPGYRDAEMNIDLPEIEPDITPISEPVSVGEYMESPAEKNAAVSKKDMSKNLNVLGIITGDIDQVIIEDKEKNKTFFLYKGDSFGDFTIYDIRNNGVVLDYKGEKIELNI